MGRSAGTFEKGKSGNPKGRPKQAGWVREYLEKHLTATVNQVLTLATHSDPKVSLAACKEILDRCIGKAQERVEVSGPDGGPVAIAAAVDIPPPSKTYEEWLERHTKRIEALKQG